MRFGISTFLYQDEPLQRSHLVEIAHHGFEAVELLATNGHFDCRNQASIDSLAEWLDHAKLALPSVHVSLTDAIAALEIGLRVPINVLVVHVPEEPGGMATVKRSFEEIHPVAESRGVRVALEVPGNSALTVEKLVSLLEGELDEMNLGICMDVGHAFLKGDPAEAIETASGHVMTTHLHDNRRKKDEHLVPFDGAIDWAETIMAFEKIGYDGVLMFEVRNTGSAQAVLERAARARKKLEELARSSELEAESFS